MPKITINQQEYKYDETDVISFTEGIIGLPEMRRAVLIPLEEYQPFCWMASLDDEKTRFVVVDPHQIYTDYEAALPVEARRLFNVENDMEIWAIVKVSSDWLKTTINLRAPLFINRRQRSGAQFVLSESGYSLAETLPQE